MSSVSSKSNTKIREASVVVRKTLVQALADAGVTGKGFSQCTNTIYSHLFGKNCKEMLAKMKLASTANMRDHMSKDQLTKLNYAEELIAKLIRSNKYDNMEDCDNVCRIVSSSIASVEPAIKNYLKKPVKAVGPATNSSYDGSRDIPLRTKSVLRKTSTYRK